tara:strand:+ start:177 stop:770 length:594 start_codon:yes stop_codon:yes gene_type:complete
MIIDKDNYYFLAPDNKNGLSVRPPRDLYLADTFEFKVNFTIDYKKCGEKSCGIVMMNGKHLGIHIYNNLLLASVWTDKGVFETQMTLDNKNIKCRFICDNKNKQVSLVADNKTSTIDFKGKLVDDYKYSYLWVGCGNGFLETDSEYRNNFYGDIHFLEIKRNDKVIFQSDFKKKTEFKVFDESNSGNHLLKYNSEWY